MITRTIATMLAMLVGSNFAMAYNIKKVDRTPESIECSKKADEQKLHGKERKKFRYDCKKELTGKTPPAPPAEDTPKDLKK